MSHVEQKVIVSRLQGAKTMDRNLDNKKSGLLPLHSASNIDAGKKAFAVKNFFVNHYDINKITNQDSISQILYQRTPHYFAISYL